MPTPRTIKDHRNQFPTCERAFLVTGKKENDKFNRNFIQKNKTGYWDVKNDRVLPGDLIFVVLPNINRPDGYPRNLWAGIVTKPHRIKSRMVFEVEKFRELDEIKKEIKRFLEGKTPPQGNKALQVWGPTSPRSRASTITITKTEIDQKFDREMKIALSLLPVERRKRKRDYPQIPEQRVVATTTYIRNPYVVIEVLERANGVCEGCRSPAPFKRKSDDQPFLEVHHIKPLAAGGKDTVRNAQALCPNCHRERHFG